MLLLAVLEVDPSDELNAKIRTMQAAAAQTTDKNSTVQHSGALHSTSYLF
jgi:hypothetical protein